MDRLAARSYLALGIFAVWAAAMLLSGEAWAANGAFAVDAADISEAGSCKLESWLSAARNTDFSAVTNPSCVVDIGRPVELSMLTNWSRSSGDWGTSFAPKIKTNIVPTAIGRLGFSVMGGGTFDAMTGENTSMNVAIPATLRLSETMCIDINGGWLWDRVLDRHYLTYGVGFDWKFTDLLQLTVEAFGQAGAPDIPSATWPRFQAGIRYRPNEIFSFDVIYGRNITGENSNWITIGSTVRFPVPSK